jgi:predicted nucleic-acid-binding protein
MIGLDTNVLVRYILQDDPVQAAGASKLIEVTLSEQNPGFVSLVAIAETVWVLDRTYGVPAETIALVVEGLLQVDRLVFERTQQVFAAVQALKDGEGEFADALIGAIGRAAGCSHTATFDRRALRMANFELV